VKEVYQRMQGELTEYLCIWETGEDEYVETWERDTDWGCLANIYLTTKGGAELGPTETNAYSQCPWVLHKSIDGYLELCPTYNHGFVRACRCRNRSLEM